MAPTQKLLDTMREGVIITDANGVILAVNRSFSRITGYTKENVMGKNPRLLQSGRHDRLFYKNMWKAIQQQGFWQGEIWNRKCDGATYPERLHHQCDPKQDW